MMSLAVLLKLFLCTFATILCWKHLLQVSIRGESITLIARKGLSDGFDPVNPISSVNKSQNTRQFQHHWIGSKNWSEVSVLIGTGLGGIFWFILEEN